MWRKKETVQQVTVVVDETNVDEAVAKIEEATATLQKEQRALQALITESKSERGRLESSIAAARRRGQGRW